MNKNHVCVITGSRADYNYLKPIIERIAKSSKLNLSLLATGMHLLKEHGNTIGLIEEDSIPITKIIPMYKEKDRSITSLGRSVGKAIIKFTEAYDEIKPDIILVLGDRYEILVAAISATTLKIPIAHIHGGDVSGTVDENIRHAVTKLSHLHFPATSKSAERIRLMGEEQWRIKMVGSTTIDTIINENLLTKEEVCNRLELDAEEKIILCLQHPNVYESNKAGDQIRITLNVLKDLNFQTILIYPNNDLGSDLIIKEIKSVSTNPKFKIFKNLERNMYLSLLKNVDLLIGNSSGGLIESPIFKLPVVNIGTRNQGRESAENVIHVSFNYHEIKKAIQKGISKEFKHFCQNVINPYGDGTASEKIIEVLENLELNEKLLEKKLTYNV
ncbi:MAG: UDP-N-acetylglucosamine 2-epimerase [Candidatus Hodarchaeota archaeon]